MDIKILVYHCLKCGFEWNPRKVDVRKCPACQSRKWNEPKEENKK